jgi:hypothetical protein
MPVMKSKSFEGPLTNLAVFLGEDHFPSNPPIRLSVHPDKEDPRRKSLQPRSIPIHRIESIVP